MSKIRPVVIYPFVQPKNLGGLEHLFGYLKTLLDDKHFTKPTTIINYQTMYRSHTPHAVDNRISETYERTIAEIVRPVSEVAHTWAVDTCAMWLKGLGEAFQHAQARHEYHDVFWLIPGDFNYASAEGHTATSKLSEIPLKVKESACEICLGEVEVPLNSAKQLIDTYGTYGLLYNWFPAEAQGIRKLTSKPRTEFFALNYQTLERALVESRWFAYEQTLMILLQNMNGRDPARRMMAVPLGKITDDESTRSSLASAMAQVERTERALKLFWRERAEREGRTNWHDEFRVLDGQSESVRTAAMVILRRLLS
jgi:hypothetical protein